MSETAHPLRDRRVLVTGARGFLGRHLCLALHALGAEVHAVSRHAQTASDAWRWWNSDWSDSEAPRALLRQIQPDVVFHFSALVTGDRDARRVIPAVQSNLLPALHLLLAAHEFNCRVVLAGTMEEPVEAARDAVASSPYAASKAATSIYARMFAHLYEVDVRILRLYMVYGPGPQENRRLIPYVIQSLLRGERPALTQGERRTDWVYVGDVVDAAIAAAVVDGIRGQTLDIGTGLLTSARDVAITVQKLLASPLSPEFGAVPSRPRETEYCADIQSTQSALNWCPRVTLEEGLRRTIDWFRIQESREPARSSGPSQPQIAGANS